MADFSATGTTHIIAISGECRNFLVEKEGVPQDKISMVWNGLLPERCTHQDAQVMERLRERFVITEERFVIGTVARFIEWKGYRHIVDCAERFVRRHPEALFLFCGQGPQEGEIRNMVDAAGLQDHVVFTGRIEPANMPSFYGVLDAYLHASELEPFGFVIAPRTSLTATIVAPCSRKRRAAHAPTLP